MPLFVLFRPLHFAVPSLPDSEFPLFLAESLPKFHFGTDLSSIFSFFRFCILQNKFGQIIINFYIVCIVWTFV